MIAVDSGFLFALADARDPWHGRALAATSTQSLGWVTTWPVLTEACYLMQERLGTEPAVVMMDDVVAGGVEIWNPPLRAQESLPALMRRYAALPMDLADATLVLLAEHLDHGEILTTDERDFGAYRWKSRKPFRNLLAEMKP
jgi:predicted nucleic acid-binding protein